MNKRAKSTEPNLSPSSSTRQSEGNASKTQSLWGRSPSGRMFRLPCKDYFTGTCNNSFCEKRHPPECLFCMSFKWCRFVDNFGWSSLACVSSPKCVYMCGSILGPFWVHFGSILGPFWIHFGSIMVQSAFTQESAWRQESTTRQESMFKQEHSSDKNSSLDCWKNVQAKRAPLQIQQTHLVTHM